MNGLEILSLISIAKPNLGAAEKEAVSQVIDSGMIACGSVVTEFEQAFAAYIEAKHGIATTSGTTALEIALRSAGIGQGDKVITTSFTFIASANSIIYVGATPVFVDIDPQTYNMDVDLLAQVLEKEDGIKAILVVHLFGHPCPMQHIMELAHKYKIMVIEDCAQAHGAISENKKVGSIGDISISSFYPTKNMTTGEGGIVLTNNDAFAERARLLINHGMKVRYHHDIIGYNYRMTNIAAAIGLCQLQKLNEMNAQRRKNAEYYFSHIRNAAVKLPLDHPWHVYHQFTIRVQNRNAFMKHLENNGIGYGIFYPLSVPEQKCYAHLHIKADEFPVTDLIKTEVISIPVHPLLTAEEVATVATVISEFKV